MADISKSLKWNLIEQFIPVLGYVLEQVSDVSLCEQKMDYICNCNSEISK